jgi:putative membrane protein
MSDRRLKDYAVISLKGMAMGAADVVPGVSGGTIAFITGIYEELVNTISNVDLSLFKTWKNEGFKAMWKQLNASFLLALMLGIGVSVISLMKLMTYLLDTYPIQVWSFFFGLVLASVWYIAKQVPKWRLIYVVALIISAVGAYLLTTLTPVGEIESLAYLFLCGALAICAMILPGISGAFILVLLGAYKQIIDAVSDLNFKVISVVGIGAIFGLLSFSRLLKWLFSKYEYLTLSILTGFVFGSLNKIWPWKNTLKTEIIHDKEIIIAQESVLPANFDGEPQVLYAIALAIVGFLLILFLEKWSSKTS